MESPCPADCDRASEVSFSIDDEVPEGVLEPHEALELTNSLKDITQSEDVKPKLQCIMSNPSFSMVTVQCEDSGIMWETSSSRCSTPWASEASTTSDVYSMESSSVGSPPGKVVFIMDEDKVRRKKILKSSDRALLSSRMKGDLSHRKHDFSEKRMEESKKGDGTKDSGCILGVREEAAAQGPVTAKPRSKEDEPQKEIPAYEASVKTEIKKFSSVSECPKAPPRPSRKKVANVPALTSQVKREQNPDLKGSLNQSSFSPYLQQPEHFDIEKDTTIHTVQPDRINIESNMSRNPILPLDRAERKEMLPDSHKESHLITEHASYSIDEAVKKGSPSLSPKAGHVTSEEAQSILHVTDEDHKQGIQACSTVTAKLLSEESECLLSYPTDGVEKEEMKTCSPVTGKLVSEETKSIVASLTEKLDEHEMYLPFSNIGDSVMDKSAFILYSEEEAETQHFPSSLPEIVTLILEKKKTVPSFHMDKTETQDTEVYLPVTSEFMPEETQCVSSSLIEEARKQGTPLHSPVTTTLKSEQSKSISSCVVDEAEKKSLSSSHERTHLVSKESCDLSSDHIDKSGKQEIQQHSSEMADTLTEEPDTHSDHTFPEAQSCKSHCSVPDLMLTPDLVSSQFSNNRQNMLSNDANKQHLCSSVSDKTACNLFSDCKQIPSVNEIAKPAEMLRPPMKPDILQLQGPGEILNDANYPDSQTNVFSIVSEGYEILNILAPTQISSVDQEESKHMEDKLEYLEENPKLKTKLLQGVGDTNSNHESDANVIDNKKDDTDPKKLLIENDSQNKETGKEVTPAEITCKVLESQKSSSDMDYFEKYTLIDDNIPVEMNIEKYPDGQDLVNVLDEKPEKKAKECISLTESPDVSMLETEYYDFDEAFYGATMENDLSTPTNSRKVLKVQKTFDRETKTDVCLVDKSEGKILFKVDEGVLSRSPFFPVNVKYIDPELLKEPPALAFLYKDLYEEARGDISKKASEQSDEDSVNSETSLPCRSSDTDDGTGIYFEKYILKDEIPFDIAESQSNMNDLPGKKDNPEQFKASEFLSEELPEAISKGVTEDYSVEKDPRFIYAQKEGDVRGHSRSDVDNEEKNNLFVRSKPRSAPQVEKIACEAHVSHEEEQISCGPCETPYGKLQDSVISGDINKDNQYDDESLKEDPPRGLVLQQMPEAQTDGINTFLQFEKKEPLEAGKDDKAISVERWQQKLEDAKKLDSKNTAEFQNVLLKKGTNKSQKPALHEKREQEGKMNMYGLDDATKLITEDRVLQNIVENKAQLSRFEVQSAKVVDNLDLQNYVSELEDIQEQSETKRQQGLDYSEEAEDLMDFDVISHDEFLHDEMLSDHTHDGVMLSEDRESSVNASDGAFEFVSDAELCSPADHEQEDSGFEIIDFEMLTAELPENKDSEKELKKSQIDTYCYTCRCPISAIDKIFGAHGDHEVTSLDNAIAEMMGRLEVFLEKLQGSSLKAEEHVSEIESLFNNVEGSCTQTEQVLDEQNEEMIKMVIAQHTEKSQSFEEVKKMKLDYLYERMVGFQQSIETAKEILEKTEKEVETPDAVALLDSFKEISARLTSAMESSVSLAKLPSAFSFLNPYAEGSVTSAENTLQQATVPSTPKLQAQESNSATSTSIAVYWTVSERDVIDCFQVYCTEQPQGNREQNGLTEEYRVTVKESYCILEDLEPDKCYNVWVMAVSNTGCSLPSVKSIFRTAPSMPLIKAEECTVCWDTAVIRWSKGNREAPESFTLEYCRQYSPEGEGLRSIAGIKGQELKVRLQPNENYFFYVRAVNTFGSSEQSEAALISTKGTRFHLMRDTACPPLQVSPDGTAMSIAENSKITGIPTVLGELLPARGWHYWETMVTSCKVFRIGACYSSTSGNWSLGENNTSWCMYCRSTATSFSCRFLHNGVVSDVLVTECPIRIGILLDYDGGRISFFSVQKGQLLFSIRHKFTEAAHPAFTLETPGQLHLHTGIETPEFVKHN